MEELDIDGKKYIPTKVAAKLTGYAKDYVGQLCREGRVECRLVGRSWYILESSILEHRFGTTASQEVSSQPAIAREVKASEEAPSIADKWEAPTYTSYAPEPIPEIHPTYLENTVENNLTDFLESESPIESELVAPVEEVAEELPEVLPVGIEEAEIEEEEVIEPIEEPVIHRSYPGSMDIAPVMPVAHHYERYEPVAAPLPRITPKTAASRSHKSRRPLRAAFLIGFVIVIGSIVLIGVGALDAIRAFPGANSPIIDFIGGVDSISK
jgi:hypothetical protein